MSRGIIRKPSFWKIVGAYRSQWKRTLRRIFIPGYGKRGIGWWKNPKKAWYNWWYYRTSISIPRLLGYRPSFGSYVFAMILASVANVFAAPVDIAKAGATAHKIKKVRKARAERTASAKEGAKQSTKASAKAESGGASASYTAQSVVHPKTTQDSSSNAFNRSKEETDRKNTQASVQRNATAQMKERSEQTYRYSFQSLTKRDSPIATVSSSVSESAKTPDENTPKSKPKDEKDQYIRKRMIIAGSSYCDAEILERLQVGTYFEMESEPDNPHDKDAVKLTLNGEKIGYIAKSDRLPFATCLKLKRRVYGVITDIITEPFPTRYEFEAWFGFEESGR